MSILFWILKSKKEMAKKDTKHVKLGKYEITSHAQNRVVQPDRNLTKKDMLINLFGNSENSKKYNRENTMQYDRVNKRNRTITHITEKEHVKNINKYHKKDEHKQFKNF